MRGFFWNRSFHDSKYLLGASSENLFIFTDRFTLINHIVILSVYYDFNGSVTGTSLIRLKTNHLTRRNKTGNKVRQKNDRKNITSSVHFKIGVYLFAYRKRWQTQLRRNPNLPSPTAVSPLMNHRWFNRMQCQSYVRGGRILGRMKSK